MRCEFIVVTVNELLKLVYFYQKLSNKISQGCHFLDHPVDIARFNCHFRELFKYTGERVSELLIHFLRKSRLKHGKIR